MKARIENDLVVEVASFLPPMFDKEGQAAPWSYWYGLGWRDVEPLPPIIDKGTQRYSEALYNIDADKAYFVIINTVIPDFNQNTEYLGDKYYNEGLGVDTYRVISYTQAELDTIEAQKDTMEARKRKVMATLTKFEFLSRFTMDEKRTIYTMESTTVDLRIWLETFRVADEIWLEDPETIVGIQSLEAAGILAVGRAAEILTPKTVQ